MDKQGRIFSIDVNPGSELYSFKNFVLSIYLLTEKVILRQIYF